MDHEVDRLEQVLVPPSSRNDGDGVAYYGSGRAVENIGGPWFQAYMRFLERRRVCVLCFWILMLVFGLLLGPKFLTLGNNDMYAPRGTLQWRAQQSFDLHFPEKANELPVLVVTECHDKASPKECSVVNPAMREYYLSIRRFVRDFNKTNNNVLAIMGYYEYDRTLLDEVKTKFVNPNLTATFVNIVVRRSNNTNFRVEFFKALKNFVLDQNFTDRDKYLTGVTGFDALSHENSAATASQMKEIDEFTMPIAFILLAYMVRSWRLLLIALLNVGASILVSFGIMTVIIEYFGAPHPESATAQLTQVIALAMSIDYGLFILRRFRDETKSGADTRRAIYIAMNRGGHVVFTSGMTVLVVFVGFMILPAKIMKMDGASCAIAILVTMLLSLSSTPCLLFLFPKFFSTFDGICGYCAPSYGHHKGHASTVYANANVQPISTDSDAESYAGEDNGEDYHQLYDYQDVNGDHHQNEELSIHPMYRSIRFHFTKLVTKWPYNVLAIVLLYVLVIPLAIQAARLKVDNNVLSATPRNSDGSVLLRHMYQDFAGGIFSPFYILINSPSGKKGSVLDPRVFHAAQTVAREIVRNTTGVNAKDISSPALLQGTRISPLMARELLVLADSRLCSNSISKELFHSLCSTAAEYKLLWNQSVNQRRTSMLVTIIVEFFPFAQESTDFISDVQRVLDELLKRLNSDLGMEVSLSARFEDDQVEFYGNLTELTEFKFEPVQEFQAKGNLELYLVGFKVGYNAVEQQVYHLFPILIVVTLVGVFTMLGIIMKSYFVPLRLALTLFFPLTAVFGTAVLIYQDGILQWTGLSAFEKVGGFFWYVPILMTTLIIGLALDYDVLLILRIEEIRARGYDIQASIVKAACETGGTINAAGIIMTLAFGGMLLGDQATVNQCGFILGTAVLFDTFVVNTVLVPALMSIGDKLAWAPKKMPMDNLISLEAPEFTGKTHVLSSNQ